MSYEFINWIVTISSLFFLISIFKAIEKNNHIGLILSVAVLISSILQHLSEKKHNLPGVLFTNYAKELLNFDRLVTITLILYGLLRLYYHEEFITYSFIWRAVIGCIVVFIGENILTGPLYHVILHPIWHLLGALCAADIM